MRDQASQIEPDVAGMGDAQERLRERLGRDVRFYGPADITYDPSIPASAFDDEGIPLDPLAARTSSDAVDVAIADLKLVGQARGNVLFQPLAAMRRDNLEETRIAIRSRLNKDVILALADIPQTEGATYFMVGTQSGETWTADDGELWKIVSAKTDGFGALQRYIVFGQSTR